MMKCAHTTSFAVGLLLVLLAGVVHGEDTKTPRTDLYGDPLPPGAVMRLGTNRLRHPQYRGVAVAFLRDGKHLISCGGYEVRVWDAATGRLVRRTRLAWKASEGEWISHVSLTPDGTTAAAWSFQDGVTKCLYDTATGQERGRLSNASVLTFSPDSKRMAVRWWDKEGNGGVQLWNIAEFKKYLSLDVPPHADLRWAAFTPDGKQMAAVGGERDEELFVWDAVTGKLRQRKKFPTPMRSLAYAPDGATLAVGRGGKAEAVLFDAASLKEKTVLPTRANVEKGGCIFSLRFSPDGRLLAGSYADQAGPDRRAGDKGYGFLIWDLREPAKPRRLLSRNYFDASAFAFAPDGKKLAYRDSSSAVIDLWDVASGRQLRQLPGHDTAMQTLAVSPDGKVLASSDSKPALLLWDTATGKLLRSLAGGDEQGSAYLLFSADGRQIISVSGGWTFQGRKMRVWETATGKELLHFVIGSPPAGSLPMVPLTVALSGDGKRLAAVAIRVNPLSGGTSNELPQLFIWDAATGKQRIRRRHGMEMRVNFAGPDRFVVLVPDAESATVWRGDQLTIEDISTNNLLAVLPKDVGGRQFFSADGRLLAAALLQPKKKPSAVDDVKGLSLIETVSGQEVARLEIGPFVYVAFTLDSRAVVVADGQKLSVWDTATGERLHQMAWPESIRNERGYAKISSLAVLPGGRVATGMDEGDILIWDLAPSTWSVRRPMRELSREQLDALWSDLARDARTAYRAVSLLTAAPARSVPFLGTRLHPLALDSKRIDKLLADLDAEQYKVRESASQELTRLRCAVVPRMRQTLQDRPSLEMRRRLENILAEPKHPTPEALRTLRAIAVLERIGTPEARRILEKLSGGATAPETRAAQAALQRLKYR